MSWRVAGLVAAVVLLAGCAGGEPGAGASGNADGGAGAPGDADGELATEPDPAEAGSPTPAASDGRAEEAGPGDLVVVSTVAPVADVVARVVGERGRVGTLVPAGTDGHTYEPRPQDVAALEEADAFFGVGLGLNDAAVRLAEANLPGGAPLVLLGEEALGAGDLLHGAGHHHDGDADHTHGGDGGAGHSHDGDEGVNPHVWTSVRNVTRLVERAAAALAELDPEGAAAYDGNARTYVRELRALDEAVAAAVETVPEGRRTLVAYHDAWSYFGRDYGLEVVAAVQPSDFSEPSAADVRAIIDQIRTEQVPAVFGSAEFPSDVLAAITAETGATYVGDLADDTLPGEPGDPGHSYVGMMARSATAVVEALGGDAGALEGFAP